MFPCICVLFFSPITVSLPTEQVNMDSGVSEGIAPFLFFCFFFLVVLLIRQQKTVLSNEYVRVWGPGKMNNYPQSEIFSFPPQNWTSAGWCWHQLLSRVRWAVCLQWGFSPAEGLHHLLCSLTHFVTYQVPLLPSGSATTLVILRSLLFVALLLMQRARWGLGLGGQERLSFCWG